MNRNPFNQSLQELRSARTITVCAMMGAAALVLGAYSIYLTPTIKIGFSSLPNLFVAWLFGPAVGLIFNGTMDILKYFLKPVGGFFPPLTLVTMIAGTIYGFFFYGKRLTFRRVLAALARELAFSLRPLDQLMAGAQEGSQGPVADFFRACRQAFAAGGRESWADSWATALEATPLPLTPEDRRLLREAGDVLGRYDGESQRAALEALLARLEDQGAQAQAEAHRLFRVYLALGVAAGLFCLILL